MDTAMDEVDAAYQRMEKHRAEFGEACFALIRKGVTPEQIAKKYYPLMRVEILDWVPEELWDVKALKYLIASANSELKKVVNAEVKAANLTEEAQRRAKTYAVEGWKSRAAEWKQRAKRHLDVWTSVSEYADMLEADKAAFNIVLEKKAAPPGGVRA